MNGSAAAVLPTSSSLFQLPHFPGALLVKEAAALGLWLCFNALQGKLNEVEQCFY